MDTQENQPNQQEKQPSSSGEMSENFTQYLHRRSLMTERGLMGGQVPYVDTDEGDWDIDYGP